MYKLLGILALATALSAATAASPAVNATAAKATKGAPAQKICLHLDGVTGSRLNSTECRTKADWEAQGVDVDELPAKSDKADAKA